MLEVSKSDLGKIIRLLSFLSSVKFHDRIGKEKSRQAALLLKKLSRKGKDGNV